MATNSVGQTVYEKWLSTMLAATFRDEFSEFQTIVTRLMTSAPLQRCFTMCWKVGTPVYPLTLTI